MKLLFLIGNTSVGKMTVGQELSKVTDLTLFHNHMTIEPVIEVFGYYNRKVVRKIRDVIFEEFSSSDNYGLIFTFVWTFDMKEDWDYVEHVTNIFKNKGADIYYAELVSPQEVRLQRNITENRLKNKASKRDIEASNSILLEADKSYRLESLDGEVKYENYIKIDNSNLNPEEVAEIIKKRFGF